MQLANVFEQLVRLFNLFYAVNSTTEFLFEFFFFKFNFIHNFNTYTTYSTKIIHTFTHTKYLLITPLILTVLLHVLLYNTVLKRLKGMQLLAIRYY